ncbi:S26 family signal peptidase [Nostoc sp. CHAB 5834]|nr:S26 family signal peptidase [Nostoc sp. CHAB 5834]
MMNRTVAFLKPAVLAMALASGGFWAYSKFVPFSIGWNHTASIPKGLYLVEDYKNTTLERGQLVCFKYAAPAWAKDREYMREGTKLCKPIVAIAGDSYKVVGDKLEIRKEGLPLKTEPIAHVDSKGRHIPVALNEGLLARGEMLVISQAGANGLDSRYLGVLTQYQVTSVIKPIFEVK